MLKNNMPAMLVGAARVDFTPPLGLPIMGHFRDDYAAKSVHDPLCARALVVANTAGDKIALLTLDLCMVNRTQVRAMREYIAAQCSIKAENILIAATHTHGAPATFSLYLTPAANEAEVESFLTRAAHAVIVADQNLRPASLSFGCEFEHTVSFNRRLRCSDGNTHMNWEDLPEGFALNCLGPIDPQLSVVSATDDDRLSAALINFSLHPAILDYENSAYTADFVGYLDQALRTATDDHGVPLFFNGCCANVNHLNYADKTSPRRGFVIAQRVGYVLAAAAERALRLSAPIGGDAIRVSREMVALARIQIDETLYEESKRLVKQRANLAAPYKADGLNRENGAPLWIKLRELQNVPDKVEVMVLRLGDLGIVGLPGEVFCEAGMAIKQASRAKHTLVIQLANDGVGYLPPREAYPQGGYEVTPGATIFSPGCSEQLVDSAHRQLETLFR
jgi:neutral ceramidase